MYMHYKKLICYFYLKALDRYLDAYSKINIIQYWIINF